MQEMIKTMILGSFIMIFSMISGCQSQSGDQVSIISEDAFESVSMTGHYMGNGQTQIEIMSDLPPAKLIFVSEAPFVQEALPEVSSVVNFERPDSVENLFELKVQTALKNAGYYKGVIDGEVGPKTRRAIKSFQTANHLEADGLVGSNTWNELKRFYYGSNSG